MADVFKVQGKVGLDSSEFHKSVDKVKKEGQSLAASIEKQMSGIKGAVENAFSFSIGTTMSNIAQKAAQAATQFVKESISIASGIQEVQNVVDVTFGDAAEQLGKWATNARTQFGLTELQAKEYASTMGAMLKSMGIAESKVYDMSTAMAGLSADMASFYNIDFDTAFAKIRSGISGETEPLKQLGINLNVANLEAYALANGMKKSYDSMTQAEQATLRYNYLLQVTADAQGDFARTSDSYANSLRLLETNVDSLKAHLGEMLLPVVNSVVNAINGLFETAQSESGLEAELKSLDEGYEATANSIVLNQARAKALIGTVEELQSKQNLTTEETLRYKGAVDALCEIYPELNKYVSSLSGLFLTNATNIKAETEALAENALAKARLAVQQEKITAAARAVAEAEDAYQTASAKSTADAAAHSEKYKQYTKERENFVTALSDAYQSMLNLDGLDESAMEDINNVVDTMLTAGVGLENALNLVFGDSSFLQGNEAVYAALVELATALKGTYDESVALYGAQLESAAASKTAEEALASKTTTLKELTNTMGQAEAKTDGVNGELTTLARTSDEATGPVEGLATALKNIASALGVERGEKSMQEYLSEIATENDKLTKSFQAASKEADDYAKSVQDNVVKALDSLADGYSRVKRARPVSAKTQTKNAQQQTKQLNEFRDNLETLKEMGASDELLADLSEATADNMGRVAGLVSSGAEAVKKYDEAFAELENTKESVADSLSENLLTVDSQYQTLAETVSGLKDKISAVGDAVSTLISAGVSALLANLNVNTLQTSMDNLGGTTAEPTVEVKDEATSIIQSIKNLLSGLKDKTVTVTVKYVQEGSAEIPGKATGLDYVPYNDYLARLHTGEAILTRAEADRWRKGEPEGRSGKERAKQINVTQNIAAVPMTPQELAVQTATALKMLRFNV